MLRFNTSARLTTHSWGWFERGWSSAAPGGICELLLRPACLRILLQCISLFKLCHLLCPVAHNFPFASVSLVQLCSRLQTRVWCQRPWAHREIEGGGLLMQAWSHAVMLKQEKHMPDWCGGQLLGGVPDPKMFTHCSHSSVTCNPPLPVVQGHTGCFYEMRDEMCLSLHLQLSGFTPSSATKVSQHPEPHALYCWQEQWGLKINWWAALSNFSHISVETSFCQLQLWLPRQKEQRIQLYWQACMNALTA